MLDLRYSMEGRGAYVCPRAGCLERAIGGRRFARAFRRREKGPAADVGGMRNAALAALRAARRECVVEREIVRLEQWIRDLGARANQDERGET